jgi:hypothetical protein
MAFKEVHIPKERFPNGLKLVRIHNGDLIVRLDSSYGDFFKVKLDNIMEIYSTPSKIKFMLKDYKNIEFSFSSGIDVPKIKDRIIEETLKSLTPTYI